MTTDQVLAMARRLMAEVDLGLSTVTDREILEAVYDARDVLELQRLPGFADLAVGTDQAVSAAYGIVPDPTLELGVILAHKAAVDILRQTYLGRVSRGELGTSWTSGLESESTIQTEKAYRDAIAGIDAQMQGLILIKRSPTAGYRIQ